MESGSYCRRHKREKAREKRGQVLKEIITGCAITHHSTFLGKCDPGIQTRCYQSPLPPTHLSTKETPDGYVQRTKIRGKWRVGGEKIDKSKGVFHRVKRTLSDTTDLYQLHTVSGAERLLKSNERSLICMFLMSGC